MSLVEAYAERSIFLTGHGTNSFVIGSVLTILRFSSRTMRPSLLP